jgi:Double-GTPase 2
VFRFAMNRRTLFRPNSREVLLSFADSAGEDLVSPNKIELMARYLAAADAVFVLLDPLRLPDVRQRVSRRIPLPQPERPNDEVVASFNRITSLLLAGTGQQRVDKPVALILSKVDALGHLMEPDSPLRKPNPPQPYFDEADNLAVQEQVRTLLAEWGAAGLDETVRKHYSRCRYFGISALGATPTEDNRVRDAGPRPYRATEPFMWVLNQFDLVKAQ